MASIIIIVLNWSSAFYVLIQYFINHQVFLVFDNCQLGSFTQYDKKTGSQYVLVLLNLRLAFLALIRQLGPHFLCCDVPISSFFLSSITVLQWEPHPRGCGVCKSNTRQFWLTFGRYSNFLNLDAKYGEPIELLQQQKESTADEFLIEFFKSPYTVNPSTFYFFST